MRALAMFVALLALAPLRAWAGDDASSVALAQSLFEEGRDLLAKGQIEKACPKFETSYKLDPATGTLLNLGVCNERLGRFTLAWVELSDALAASSREGRADRVRVAREHLDAIRSSLGWLVLLSPSERVSVELDGRPLAPEVLHERIPLDPGAHRLEARGARGTFAEHFVVKVAEDHRVVIVFPAAPASPPAPIEVPPPPPPRDAPGSRTPWIVAAAAAAVAGGTVGTIFGFRAVSLHHDAEPECSGHVCSDAGASSERRANSAAWVSNVGFGVALAGAAAVVLLFVLPERAAISAPSAP